MNKSVTKAMFIDEDLFIYSNLLCKPKRHMDCCECGSV